MQGEPAVSLATFRVAQAGNSKVQLGILRTPLTLASAGRAAGGARCPAYLQPRNTATCAATQVLLGFSSAKTAATLRWVLEPVPGQPGVVYVRVEARPAGCAVRYLGASAAKGCSDLRVGLFAKNDKSALLSWRLLAVPAR